MCQTVLIFPNTSCYSQKELKRFGVEILRHFEL